METSFDLSVNHCGNITQFIPLTDAGRDFLEENCENEHWSCLGSIRCSRERYSHPLEAAAVESGLRVR